MRKCLYFAVTSYKWKLPHNFGTVCRLFLKPLLITQNLFFSVIWIAEKVKYDSAKKLASIDIFQPSQFAKSVKLVETLGSPQVVREKFLVVGLLLASISSSTNHRPATENFSLITWGDPNVSNIFTLLATFVICTIVDQARISEVCKVRQIRLSYQYLLGPRIKLKDLQIDFAFYTQFCKYFCFISATQLLMTCFLSQLLSLITITTITLTWREPRNKKWWR